MEPTDDAGVAAVLPEWPLLGAEERERLFEVMHRLLTSVRWEAARGFTLTEQMPLAVAAHAALFLLGRDRTEDPPHPRAVVLHPGTIVMRGERAGPTGTTRSSGPFHLSGQRGDHLPMLLSWRDIETTIRRPGRGHNVVVHEFAHELDAADGVLDGTPPLRDPALRSRWIETCTEVFERLHGGDHVPLIRSYGGTTPSEFFAVVSELFIDRPTALAEQHPALYDLWCAALGQDPAARRPRT